MSEYHKIHSVYKRDPSGKRFLVGEYSLPEFEYLKDLEWVFTEKVDGTNVRVRWDGVAAEFGGRTDSAQMPTFLYKKLQEIFLPDRLWDALGGDNFVLYGEGYGAKIQKGGGDYIADGCGFILFDVYAGSLWLKREDVEDIANKLSIPCVPVVGTGTLGDAERICRDGFESRLKGTPPEGLVMRPKVELRTRRGERVITKLKLRDFR